MSQEKRQALFLSFQYFFHISCACLQIHKFIYLTTNQNIKTDIDNLPRTF
jgi:hypothetical protein